METIKNFNIKRLLLMLQKDIFENYKTTLIGLSSVIGLLFIFTIMISGESASQNFSMIYRFTLFITGIFVSGMAFTAFRIKEKTMTYLTIPASTLEKFISMLDNQ